ncbi:porin family protein [Granulicella cerasi]|uniref:Porin family protein n=1 Tax=Granulicella cerasi TaxID=741063 RepID=A0ABW1ZAA0_9BACT|nr:porin family protein [Granulicella cerasi]
MVRPLSRVMRLALRLSVCAFLLLPALQAHGQATTAGTLTEGAHVDVFLTGTLTHTGFVGSDRGLTGGVNYSLRHIFGFEPAAELRATTSLFSASDAAHERSFFLGPVVRRRIGRFEPYGDFLWGRGTITYPGTYLYEDNQYVRTAGGTHEYGGGLGIRLNDLWSLKFDIQQQHWNVPVLPTGQTFARSASFGVTRRFGLRHDKELPPDKNDPKWHTVCQDHPLLCKK